MNKWIKKIIYANICYILYFLSFLEYLWDKNQPLLQINIFILKMKKKN